MGETGRGRRQAFSHEETVKKPSLSLSLLSSPGGQERRKGKGLRHGMDQDSRTWWGGCVFAVCVCLLCVPMHVPSNMLFIAFFFMPSLSYHAARLCMHAWYMCMTMHHLL